MLYLLAEKSKFKISSEVQDFPSLVFKKYLDPDTGYFSPEMFKRETQCQDIKYLDSQMKADILMKKAGSFEKNLKEGAFLYSSAYRYYEDYESENYIDHKLKVSKTFVDDFTSLNGEEMEQIWNKFILPLMNLTVVSKGGRC